MTEADSPRPTRVPDQFGGKLSSPNIQVISATAEQGAVLANLLEFYAYDFSEFLDLDLEANGKFGCFGDLPTYWREPDRHPFLVQVEGNLAGLVLVKRGSEFSGRQAIWDMAEFFVVQRHRRRGIGARIAQEVWRRLPGSMGSPGDAVEYSCASVLGARHPEAYGKRYLPG